MKKIYEAPTMDIVVFSAEDVMLASEGGIGGDFETDIMP